MRPSRPHAKSRPGQTQPGVPAAVANAQALVSDGRHAEAAVVLLAYIRRQPRDARAAALLGMAAAMSGDVERGRYFTQRARAIAPNDLMVQELHASVLAIAGVPAEAIAAYRKVLAADPDRPNSLEGLALLLTLDQSHAEVAELAGRALRLMPGDGPFTALLAGARQAYGHAREGLALIESALAGGGGGGDSGDNLHLLHARAASMNYVDGLDPRVIAQAHRDFGRCLEALAGEPMPERAAGAETPKPLRVGFVSPDLRTHSCAYFIEPLVGNMDRARVTPIAFNANKPAAATGGDPVTARLRALFGEWHEIQSLSDRAAAELVRARGIDILIDLCGLMTGERLGVFALRPAPVQATYLGYPNTTGLSRINWRIIDGVTDPDGFEDRCSERLMRLDGCFVCYGPVIQNAPDPAAAHREGGEGVVFASFNILSKVTDPVVRLWARIVNAVPGSRLLLKAAVLAHESGRADTLARFAASGLAPERIELMGWVKSDPLLVYERVDVGLDPFPYNGTTTTAEALWMGVPVVALEGTTHAGRVGASLLRHAGLGDLVASSEEEYVRIAAGLGSDRPRIAGYRGTLRGRVRGSICDTAAFCRRFESALERMWRETAGGR